MPEGKQNEDKKAFQSGKRRKHFQDLFQLRKNHSHFKSDLSIIPALFCRKEFVLGK